MKKQTLIKVFLPVLLAGLTACGSDSNGDGQNPGEQDQGRLTLGITDAPVDEAAHVVIQFTGVTLKPFVGEAIDFEFDTPRQIDVLALQGGLSEPLLDNVAIPMDDYESITLHVSAGTNADDSYIELKSGGRHPLHLPEENANGLQVGGNFAFGEDGAAAITIDFDLRKSIHAPSSANLVYTLSPALRAVENAAAGSIEGTVMPELIDVLDCTPAVYVWEGMDAGTFDVGHEDGPVSTALVSFADDSNSFTYTAAFLPEGDYTVGLTCDSARDTAEADDLVQFMEVENMVSVKAGETTTQDF